MHAGARKAKYVGDEEVGLVAAHVDAQQLKEDARALDWGVLVLSTAQSVVR